MPLDRTVAMSRPWLGWSASSAWRPGRADRILFAMAAHIEIAEESTPKRAFVWSIEWPGWCRGGKDLDLARTAFLEAAARYADVAALAGEAFPPGEAAS